MKQWVNILLCILIIIFIFLSGYFTCRYTDKRSDGVVVYSDTMYVVSKDTVLLYKERPVPYRVIDSVFVEMPVDTATLYEVWRDYYRKREYCLDYSNDTLGTYIVNTEVAENEIKRSSAIIIPKTKVITNTKEVPKVKFIQGFVSVGTSVHNLTTQQITLGMEFKERWDVSVTGVRYKDDVSYTVNFGVKF